MGEDALIAAVLAEDSERQDSWKVFFFVGLLWLYPVLRLQIVGGGKQKVTVVSMVVSIKK